MSFLLDTCVVSDQISKRPDPGVARWLDSIDPDSAYLSVLSIGEIQKGIEKLRDPRRKEALESWLQEDLLIRFLTENLTPAQGRMWNAFATTRLKLAFRERGYAVYEIRL